MSGGWQFGPVESRELPSVRLTKKQLKENDKARLKHKAVRAALDKIIKKVEERVAKLGGSLRVDDYSFYPDLILPHDEDAYDFAKFTDADMAYYKYLQKNWWEDTTEALGTGLLEAGLVLGWQFSGMSVGRLPIPAKDWPEVPSWARSDKYMAQVRPNPER